MTSSMSTVVIVGGTTGLGLSFAKRLHSKGKKVIVTGRPNTSRLFEVSKHNSGIETYGFDVTDLSSIPSHVDKLFTTYPDIDTVWLNAGIQNRSDLKDLSSTTDADYIHEITANLSGPLLLTRNIVPRLLARSKEGKQATLMLTSSGLAFVPLGGLFPVYCATKAAVHQYTVGVRQALKGTGVNVIEIVPPYVEGTELGPGHKDLQAKMKGMDIDEYTDDTFKILDGHPAAQLKEVSAGSGIPRMQSWRDGPGKLMVEMGVSD
ncbi:hypothetical protein ANO11243_047020 [Dothideomycetidae sp. 11243]|nr:hypothetical protein ANO11243_047020 [fungal sp. No.11243]